jgi:hypothetical protein
MLLGSQRKASIQIRGLVCADACWKGAGVIANRRPAWPKLAGGSASQDTVIPARLILSLAHSSIPSQMSAAARSSAHREISQRAANTQDSNCIDGTQTTKATILQTNNKQLHFDLFRSNPSRLTIPMTRFLI